MRARETEQGPPTRTTASRPRGASWRTGALLLALIVATLAVYQPAWNGALLWDDGGHITRPALRTWDGLRRIWVDPGATQQYYPLLHSAFWLQHRAWIEQTAIGARGADYSFTLVERGLIAGRAIWFHLPTLPWPANLVFNYPRWSISASDWRQYLYPLAVIAALAGAWAAAHHNLGVALEAAGRPGEAAAHYQEALRLRPSLSRTR